MRSFFPGPRRRAEQVSALVLTLLFLLPTHALAAELTAREKRGRVVYFKTVSPSGGEISATVGAGGIEAPGEALPCVNCHGFEGEGLQEHGISATNITWEDLGKPYWTKRPGPRQYPPYTEETLGRAIREGVDPAGNPLDPSMPRYRLPQEDLDDLIAFLKVIHKALDPGLTENSIKVGSILPASGPLASMGQAVKRVLEAYFAEINASGGLFNRKIVLHTREYRSALEDNRKEYEALIDEDEVFALVTPFDAGTDTEHLSALLESREVPAIGPFTLYPDEAHVLNRYTFYLYSGLKEQALAQVDFAWKRFGKNGTRAAVVYAKREGRPQTAEAIEERASKYGWAQLERVEFSVDSPEWEAHVSRLKTGRVGIVFFLGSFQDFKGLAQEADKQSWAPDVFISGTQVRPEIFELPPAFLSRIFAAYPTLPGDYTQEGMRELNQLGAKHNLSKTHMTAQIAAFCSAKLLLEGLKRAGAKPSREKLVAALERLDKFETGLTPEIGFGPNQRIGSLGAYIVALDPVARTLAPVNGWISLN